MGLYNRRGIPGAGPERQDVNVLSDAFSLLRVLLLSIALFCLSGLSLSLASAQPIHEEAEPNDTPAQAPLLNGPVRIRGAVGVGDDSQDAFVWKVSEADARHRWTITLDGNEAPRTQLWLMRLSYEDASRKQVLKRETLLTRSVAAGHRPLTLHDVLVSPGEYLIGISTAGSPPGAGSPLSGVGRNLQSAGSLPAQQAAGTAAATTEGALDNARYELVLEASEKPYMKSPVANTDKRPISFGGGRGTDFLTQDAATWGTFRIGRNEAGQRWDISGALDLGMSAKIRLVDDKGNTLTQTEIVAGQAGQFIMPSLVLATGQYRVVIERSGEALHPSHVLLRAQPVGQVVDGEEAEPNDSIAQANQLTLGRTLRGRADRQGDKDHFRFAIDTGQAGQALNLIVTFDEAAGNARVCLRNAAGKDLQCRQRGTEAGDVELSSLVLPVGSHSLEVSGMQPDASYEIAVSFQAPPRAGQETEPNDNAELASDMGRRRSITGTLQGEDVDVVSFEVTEAEHQYRLQAKGVGRMRLTDAAGRHLFEMNARDASGIIRAEALDLLPGRYWATLSRGRSERYRLLVRDLGQLPDDFEREPNDSLAGAGRLRDGASLRGILPDGDGRDMLVFRLDGRDWRRLKIQAPDDATMRVALDHQGTKIGQADVSKGESLVYDRQFEAGFYTLAIQSQTGPSLGHYQIALEVIDPPAELAMEREPNNFPFDATPVAAGGHIQGRADGLGGFDYFTAPKPEGEGFLVHVCDAANHGMMTSSFASASSAATEKPVSARAAVNAFAFTAEDAGHWLARYRDQPYDCRLHVEPETMAIPADETLTVMRQALAAGIPDDSAAFKTELARLMAVSEPPVRRDTRLRGIVYSARHTVRVPIDAPAGSALRVGCAVDGVGGDASVSARMAQRDRARPMDSASVLFRTDPDGDADALLIQATQSDWSRPVPFVCDVHLQAAMQPWPAPAEPPAWTMTAPMLSVSRVAGYLPHGQRLSASLTLKNRAAAPIELSLHGRVTGRAWRLAGLPTSVTVAAGQARQIDFEVLVAPYASTLTSPRVLIDSSDGRVHRSTASIPIQVSDQPEDAAPAARVRATPDILAGGLNVLNVRRGGRVVSIEGKPAAEPGKRRNQDLKHDGDAPLESGSGVKGADIVFEVAGAQPIPLVGFVMSLRSVSGVGDWIHSAQVMTSEDGQRWSAPLNWRFESLMERQYLVLPEAVSARFVRLRLLRSFDQYRRLFFNEFMAIARPGDLPDTLTPINIADEDWGGHLVASRGIFGPLHLTRSDRSAAIERRSRAEGEEARPRYWILGFASDRKALIDRIEWVRDPKDKSGSSQPIRVSIAADDINDFQPVGELTRPEGFDAPSVLKLETPRWARFVRFETDAPVRNVTAPSVVNVFEALPDEHYLPVAGLWDEDDRRGPYEWFHEKAPERAIKRGGKGPEDAPLLAAGETFESSARYGEHNADWLSLGKADTARELVFALDGGNDLRQTSLGIVDGEGRSVPLRTLKVPAVDENGEPVHGVVFDAQRPDRKLHAVTLKPEIEYFARVTVPARHLSLRAENIGNVRTRSLAITRTLREWASLLNDQTDGLQLPQHSPYAGSDGFVRGRLAIIKSLNSKPLEGRGTSSFATAMQQVAEVMAPLDGAKLMVGLATGAIFSDADDYWYPEVLAEQPLRFWSMYVACPGVFGCPSTWRSANRMRAVAAASNGQFRRLSYPDDAEEALNQAMVYLNADKPYRLSMAQGRAMKPAEMTPGALLVNYSEAVRRQMTPAVALVLDASGSMLKRMPGSNKRRIETARESLNEFINKGLSDDVMFSYRAFGLKPKACETRQILRLGRLNRQKAVAAIAKTPVANLARTAIAASLRATGKDLSRHKGPRVIVLVTDGEETCDGDVAGAIEQLRAAGLDVKVQIVGFAIDDEPLKQQFAAWAAMGNGEYFDATDSDTLTRSLVRAVSDRYSVQPLDGRPLLRGQIGEMLPLPPGDYRISTDDDQTDEMTVTIRSGHESKISLNRR